MNKLYYEKSKRREIYSVAPGVLDPVDYQRIVLKVSRRIKILGIPFRYWFEVSAIVQIPRTGNDFETVINLGLKKIKAYRDANRKNRQFTIKYNKQANEYARRLHQTEKIQTRK